MRAPLLSVSQGVLTILCSRFFLFRLWSHHQVLFFFSSRRRHTRLVSDWSSDVCSSDLVLERLEDLRPFGLLEGTDPRGGTGSGALQGGQRWLQHSAGRQDDGAFDDVLQFPDIAWPGKIGRASCREKCRPGGVRGT